jgi:hypothetical protein
MNEAIFCSNIRLGNVLSVLCLLMYTLLAFINSLISSSADLVSTESAKQTTKYSQTYPCGHLY